ncbi:radial spoke head protein 6 homolog A isoform X1 [Amyelois transitella]|uniref:radial spoke head protein 6 homolog A isoform X1 n=1 Tax=Amyelois transitella TaxID=680683 RepID=UPI00067E360B|nr:radial spoke head protein 6 homolog A isoform X1 [Amyelois transitella]
MSQTFLLEPDLIAATENVMPDLNNDLVLAKNFLKQQSAATGDTLYDHLVDVIHKIISQKPPDVVDNLEQYSWQVKQEKFRPNFDLLNDVYLSPPQLSAVRSVDEMIRLIESKYGKIENLGEEEQELDLEEDSMKPRIVDLIDHNYYFKEAGYGLPDSECYAVFLSLNMLGIKEPVATVRFFGKIFGTQANYYVAETDLTIEELDRRIREFDMKDMPGEGEGEEVRAPEAEEQEVVAEGEGKEEKPKEPQPPKLPPVPESTWQPPPPIPVERPGQGANRKVFWVCNRPGDPWICLPDVTPDQIRVARLTVRCMTGDLDAEVLTFPPFDGTEKNYLRAQIARIQAATSISPQGFFTFGSGEEEEDIDMEEGAGDMAFNPNPFYQGHLLKDLVDSNFTYWVHHGRYILKQGRTIWWNPNAGMEEGVEEEEDEGPPPIEPESGPSLFTPLSEDGRVEGMTAWTARVSTSLLPDRALAILRSNIWPGAVAYANTGKKSECMYMGWGLKFQPPNFSPLQLPRPQDEYIVGPEVMEMADPTFADEEAYRIAHLPPPPPPAMMGEGEGFGEEQEEED